MEEKVVVGSRVRSMPRSNGKVVAVATEGYPLNQRLECNANTLGDEGVRARVDFPTNHFFLKNMCFGAVLE